MSVVSRSDLSGKRVLVTGASGFTGRYMVAELLAQGCHVVALGSQDTVEGAHETIVADLRNPEELVAAVAAARADRVVHLAALAFVGHGNVEDFYSVNLLRTRNLLAALEQTEYPPAHILLASSANVYGNASAGVLDEDTIPSPANDYAVSKLAMEHVAGLWHGRLPITVVRPFNYTGVGQAGQFLIPKIVSHFARRAEVMELGNLEVARDFGDVRSVVAAYGQLLQTSAAIGRTVNVCTGLGHTLMEIVQMCARITGHALEIRVNPAFVRANEVKILVGDNRRLRSLIGNWDPVPMEQTLRWMLGVSA